MAPELPHDTSCGRNTVDIRWPEIPGTLVRGGMGVTGGWMESMSTLPGHPHGIPNRIASTTTHTHTHTHTQTHTNTHEQANKHTGKEVKDAGTDGAQLALDIHRDGVANHGADEKLHHTTVHKHRRRQPPVLVVVLFEKGRGRGG